MRKITFVLWLFLLFPSITWAQEKVEAPVWNVGDKWVFTQGNIECVDGDQNSYGMKFSNDTCALENQGFNTILFDKSTLNRIGVLELGKQKGYTMGLRRILNFPFNIGKQWKDGYTGKRLVGELKGTLNDSYDEVFTVLGWETLEVRAGKFRAIKLEYKHILTFSQSRFTSFPFERKSIYWYSPAVKYFIKCQYDKSYPDEVKDWELASFKGKK
jgi:hypothetical protein